METYVSKDPISRDQLLISLGRMVETCGSEDFPSQLRQILVEICGTPLGLCVYTFQKDSSPYPLIATTIYEEGLADYCGGLYLLDPYYDQFCRNNFSGFATWDDIAPDNYKKTLGLYWDYFSDWNFLDEAGYVVPVSDQISLHLSIARDQSQQRYDHATTSLLRDLYPIISALMIRNWRLLDLSIDTGEPERRQLHKRIQSTLHEFGSSVLTPREQETVRLLLLGNSYKTISRTLGISLGTVNTHRANIYQKLEISSLGELFSLFLTAMSSTERDRDKGVLSDDWQESG